MLLAIDIGNSAIKAAGFHAPGAPTWVSSSTTRRDMTSDDLEILLRNVLILNNRSFEDVAGVAAVSVVPSLAEALDQVARRRLGSRPMVLASSVTLPMPVRVDHPHEVGADRLVDAYAAHRLHGGPLVVADLGTAITVDAVGRDGAFLGGCIAAGPDLGLRALAEHTAQLPRVALASQPQAIGRNTVMALQAGAVFGWRGLIGELIARVRDELADLEGVAPAQIRTVMTGGLSASAWAQTIEVDIVDQHLALKGLAQFYREITGGPLEAPQ